MNQSAIELRKSIDDFGAAIKILEDKQPANSEALNRLKDVRYGLLDAFYVINKPESKSTKKENINLIGMVWQQYVELWDDTVKKGPEVQRTIPTKDIVKIETKNSILVVTLLDGAQYQCNFMEFK